MKRGFLFPVIEQDFYWKKNSIILLAILIIADSPDINIGDNQQHCMHMYQIITLRTYVFFSQRKSDRGGV